jgi:hypothetical protein
MQNRHFPHTIKQIKRKPGRPKGSIAKNFRPGSVSARIVPLLPKFRNTVIARMIGCTSELVRRIRLRARIPVPTDETLQYKIEKIRRMTEAGLTAPEIAKGLGVKSVTIYKIARKHGITVIKGIPGVRLSFDVNKLKALLAEGNTFCSAAKILGICNTTAFRWAKRFELYSVRSISRPK